MVASPGPLVGEATYPKDRGKTNECTDQWEQVRDKLVQLVHEGNADVARYGDMITDEPACTRFLRGAKGKVDKGNVVSSVFAMTAGG